MGRAATTWATVESSLATFFTRLTRMESTLARRVFYSARSFQGRIDMLQSVLACPTVRFAIPEERDYISLALKRATGYVFVRNAIAHDLVFFFGFDGHEHSYKHVIVEGKYDRYLGGENALTIEHILKFHKNISHLVMLNTLFLQGKGDQELLAQYHAMLARLPKTPCDSTMSPSDEALLLSLLPENLQMPL